MPFLVRFAVRWGFLALVGAVVICSAHQPVREPSTRPAGGTLFDSAVDVGDPTRASVAVYGRLGTPTELDVYRFTATSEQDMPVEAFVPVRTSNALFRPTVAVIGPDIGGSERAEIPFTIPAGQHVLVIPSPQEEPRAMFFEPFSVERLYHGREERVHVTAGNTYYAVVFDPAHYMGDYSLGLGVNENFSGVSYPSLIGNVIALKFGLVGGKPVPLADILGTLLFFVGAVIGWGAVADGRHLSVALMGVLIGGSGMALLDRISGLSGVALLEIAAAALIVIAAMARWPKTYRGGWIAEAVLVSWFLLVLR